MKYYVTNQNDNSTPQVQFTTKLTGLNSHRLNNLREWFKEQGLNLQFDEVVNDLLEHAFKSEQPAVKINDKTYSYSELIMRFDKDFEYAEENFLKHLADFGYHWMQTRGHLIIFQDGIPNDTSGFFKDHDTYYFLERSIDSCFSELYDALEKEIKNGTKSYGDEHSIQDILGKIEDPIEKSIQKIRSFTNR